METLKLDTWGLGNSFDDVAKKAQAIAAKKGVVAEFEFNGVVCRVNAKTNLNWLYRDYANSWTMDWKTVGPDCVEHYQEGVAAELNRRTEIKEKEAELRRQELEQKDAEQERMVNSWIEGIVFNIIEGKEDEYAAYVEKNSNDGYSRDVVDYAEVWAKIMQRKLIGGASIADIANESQKELGYLGITGFQYGCAVGSLARFWAHGEELRKWHNKEYGVSEDKKGVVNSAILTIG